MLRTDEREKTKIREIKEGAGDTEETTCRGRMRLVMEECGGSRYPRVYSEGARRRRHASIDL